MTTDRTSFRIGPPWSMSAANAMGGAMGGAAETDQGETVFASRAWPFQPLPRTVRRDAAVAGAGHLSCSPLAHQHQSPNHGWRRTSGSVPPVNLRQSCHLCPASREKTCRRSPHRLITTPHSLRRRCPRHPTGTHPLRTRPAPRRSAPQQESERHREPSRDIPAASNAPVACAVVGISRCYRRRTMLRLGVPWDSRP